MKRIFTKLFIVSAFLCFFITSDSYSQISLEQKQTNKDTASVEKPKLKDFGISDSKTPAEWIQIASVIINDLFIKSVQKIDTTKWNAEFESLDKDILEITQEVVRVKNLNISLKEINDLESRALGLKNKLDYYSEDIKESSINLVNRYALASMINEDSFYKVIGKDSSLKVIFNDEFKSLKEAADTIKSMNLKQIKNLTVSENRRNELAITLAVVQEALKRKSVSWHIQIVTKDQPGLWNIFGTEYPDFGTVTYSSFNFVYNSFTIYFRNAWSSQLIAKLLFIIIFVAVLYYVGNFRIKKKLDGYNEINFEYINDFPRLIMFLVILTVFRYMFDYPPIILTQGILLITMIIVSYIIFQKYIERKYLVTYLFVFAYYILVKINDFILEPSLYERFFYFLSIVPAVLLIKAYRDFSRKPFGNIAFIKALILFLIVHFLFGFILNLLGYITLSKLIISGGVRSFFMGIFMTIAVYSVLDFIYLLSHYYDVQSTSLKLDISKIKSKLTWLLVFFASLFWFILYLKEMNTFAVFSDSLIAFLIEPRTVGSTEFNFGSLLLFPFVLFLSFYVSGMIKQIIEVSDITQEGVKRSNAGGILLILRLLIVGFGILLAMAASGLPLDKLTILVSALGVGIGFGLQNIINNLVSGVIIAVERPFRVGDLVNFGGIEGTVKIIGIRSSVITSDEGSELIIPNGDLISKNLINWTSNNKLRKDRLNVEITSEIKDDDFLKIVNDAIHESEVKDNITGLQINIVSYIKGQQKWELTFWVNDISRHASIKSSLIQCVFEELNDNGIQVTTFQ